MEQEKWEKMYEYFYCLYVIPSLFSPFGSVH